MTGVRDITRLCFSSNLAGIVANKIEQSLYSVYSYSGIKSIKHTLSLEQKMCFVSLENFLLWILGHTNVEYTVYTCVQVERVYKSNPIFEAKNTTFLEKV